VRDADHSTRFFRGVDDLSTPLQRRRHRFFEDDVVPLLHSQEGGFGVQSIHRGDDRQIRALFVKEGLPIGKAVFIG